MDAAFEDDFAKDFADDDDDDDNDDNNNDDDDAAAEHDEDAKATAATPHDDDNDDDASSISSGESAADVMQVDDGAVRSPSLRTSMRYGEFLAKLAAATEAAGSGGTVPNDALARHRAQQVITQANETMVSINAEIGVLHQIASRLYKPAFPQLAGLVPDPADYARVVLAYGRGDEANLSFLAAGLNTVVKMEKSTSKAKVAALAAEDLARALDLCAEVCALDADKARIIQALEVLMRTHAPNTFELVGSRTAALLVGIAGGLEELARMPSNDIQVMGRKKAQRANTGVVAGEGGALARHGGVVAHCPLVLSAPRDLRRRVLRTAAGRLALAARLDFTRKDPTGGSGRAWREEIEKKIASWMDAGPGKTVKALPLPDLQRAKRRGGRRARRQKELLGMTELRALVNREKFGTGEGEDEYSASAMGRTLGMVGKSGVGSLGKARAVQVRDTQRLGDKAAKKLRGINAAGASAVSGLTSIAFTPVQGMELAQPKAAPSMLPPPPPKAGLMVPPPSVIRKKTHAQ